MIYPLYRWDEKNIEEIFFTLNITKDNKIKEYQIKRWLAKTEFHKRRVFLILFFFLSSFFFLHTQTQTQTLTQTQTQTHTLSFPYFFLLFCNFAKLWEFDFFLFPFLYFLYSFLESLTESSTKDLLALSNYHYYWVLLLLFESTYHRI